jgi:Rnl2 family RNA ligase
MYQKYVNRDRFIEAALAQYPELLDAEYLVAEKIHGSHITLVFEPGGKLTICSRNRLLAESDKHFGGQAQWDDECQELANVLASYATRINKPVAVHGEIFGPGVQSGVDYGRKKQIRIFDMRINGDLVPQKVFLDRIFELTPRFNILRYVVPIIGIVKGLDAALATDIEFNSHLSPPGYTGANLCEGVVIKPLNKVYTLSSGSTFYLKKKNGKFSEQGKAKPVKDRRSFSENAHKLREEFLSLINKNRVESVFSKEGTIETPQEMGRYIKLVIEDATIDLIKDYGEVFHSLEKKERKYVLNAGKEVVALLKEYL